MNLGVTHEAVVFLFSVLSGIFIGFVGDLFYLLRKKSENFRIFIDITDIIFWILCAIIMFAVIFFANNGQIRWYEFLGVFLGSILYKFTLSKPILVIFELILRIFFKIFKLFFKILLTPLIFLYNIVFEGIMCIFRPFFKMVNSIRGKIVKKMHFTFRVAHKNFRKR
ncbi:MAG: spore cortex biosynthesis protein YabQ [Clostridia bacterium]|nr:spore cortex biosynthesis protein YabQ [Clostridia bacterium]